MESLSLPDVRGGILARWYSGRALGDGRGISDLKNHVLFNPEEGIRAVVIPRSHLGLGPPPSF